MFRAVRVYRTWTPNAMRDLYRSIDIFGWIWVNCCKRWATRVSEWHLWSFFFLFSFAKFRLQRNLIKRKIAKLIPAIPFFFACFRCSHIFHVLLVHVSSILYQWPIYVSKEVNKNKTKKKNWKNFLFQVRQHHGCNLWCRFGNYRPWIGIHTQRVGTVGQCIVLFRTVVCVLRLLA